MKVKFVRFQAVYNGMTFWVNPLNVTYVNTFPGRETSVLTFGETEEGFIEVVDNVEAAVKKLEDGINGSGN